MVEQVQGTQTSHRDENAELRYLRASSGINGAIAFSGTAAMALLMSFTPELVQIRRDYQVLEEVVGEPVGQLAQDFLRDIRAYSVDHNSVHLRQAQSHAKGVAELLREANTQLYFPPSLIKVADATEHAQVDLQVVLEGRLNNNLAEEQYLQRTTTAIGESVREYQEGACACLSDVTAGLYFAILGIVVTGTLFGARRFFKLRKKLRTLEGTIYS